MQDIDLKKEFKHLYAPSLKGKPAGKHHEIYLGDPRKTAPEKLKTVIRQPYKMAHNLPKSFPGHGRTQTD